jgi:LmbE family N-acetylglucosaminyl deacetylase
MKILAVGAHPDDIEIFMYGILSIFLKRNDKISMIVATDGGAGTVTTNKNLSEIRKKETIEALKIFGTPIFLDYLDGELSTQSNLTNTLKKHINDIVPDLIITHPPEDYHHDHRSLSNYVKLSAGFKYPVLFCETLMGVNFNPNIYIDISKYFQDKTKAILKHKSQKPENFLKAVEINNKFRAAQCNAGGDSYAEVFRFEPSFPFVDIRSLIPQTMTINQYYNNSTKSLI